MRGYYKVPLLFLFIGSLIGVFLRWQFISPTSGVNYMFFLHAHSHIMFLGWIFNVLYIAFITKHIDEKGDKFFLSLFWVLQALNVGMLISFPLEGYGPFSILFSTLHTIGAILFVTRFFIKTKNVASTSSWYAKTALLFFAISAAGPFSLGYLMSNGMGNSIRYNFSIYFYLHFQYNGFFLFGIFSLFFSQLEKKNIRFQTQQAKSFGIILAAATVPAYILSTLWAKPGYLLNIIGAASGIVQCFCFVVLLTLVRPILTEMNRKFTKPSAVLLFIALSGFGLKLLLQMISAFPYFAQMAYELRPIVIAYLHLVLVGVVTSFLLVWYVEEKVIRNTLPKRTIYIYITSFLGMETCLVLTPWWNTISESVFLKASEFTFLFSAILCLSFLFIFTSSFAKPDKNHLIKD
jgi:hypothetical protein